MPRPQKNDNLATSLLDLDDDFDPSVDNASNDDDQDQGDQDKKKKEDIDAKIALMDKRLKDSQEFIRQQKEQIDELSEFKRRLTEDPEEKKQKRKELELRSQYDNDPLNTTKKLMTEELSGLKQDLEVTKTKLAAKDAMQEIEREYEVDWDKNSKLILAQLDNFSPEVRKADPKGTLLRAMKLADVLKKREGPLPPFVEGGGRNPGVAAKQTEADLIKKRIFGEPKKSDNVFGI